jgi:hypothetical protein
MEPINFSERWPFYNKEMGVHFDPSSQLEWPRSRELAVGSGKILVAAEDSLQAANLKAAENAEAGGADFAPDQQEIEDNFADAA